MSAIDRWRAMPAYRRAAVLRELEKHRPTSICASRAKNAVAFIDHELCCWRAVHNQIDASRVVRPDERIDPDALRLVLEVLEEVAP